ncbi:Photosystem I reaction center subunit III [Myxosarcina sp. GI1(2024)]
MMRKLFTLILILSIWFAVVPTASANDLLVKCKDSPAYQERVANYPNNYYFNQPDRAYAEYLPCGTDGLPHLVISFRNTIDIAIAFGIFFYITGFIGWSGRSYLQAINEKKSPQESEIFIDLPLSIKSLAQGLVWPTLAVKELLSGELTAKDNEIPVSPR